MSGTTDWLLAAEPLVGKFAGAFTRPTLRRFLIILLGGILTMGRRTVSRMLWTTRGRWGGHFSSYHRFFSTARYSMWQLGRILAAMVLELVPPDRPVQLAADDSLVRRWGTRVWAKGWYRDPVRASTRHQASAAGHRWLILSVLVRLPWTNRHWALPILIVLSSSSKVQRACFSSQRKGAWKRPVRTQSALLCLLLRQMMRWFPDRRFVLMGDARVSTHAVACFAWKHRQHLTVVGRLRRDACLYNAPSRLRRARGGEYTKKGHKLPSPWRVVADAAAAGKLKRAQVGWYGDGQREVDYFDDSGLWFNNHDNQVVSVRWVCVKQEDREDYFYATDPAADPTWVIGCYALRWNLEVTIQESRQWLGLQSTREWCRRSVQRVVPLQLGLFTLVALLWNHANGNKAVAEEAAAPTDPPKLHHTPCYRKTAATFADALFGVRRRLWEELLVRTRSPTRGRNTQPPHPPPDLLDQLAAAA